MPKPDAHGLEPLLQGALAGQREALDALLGKLRPYLHALVRARIGPEAPAGFDQSAIVQDGLLRIYLGLDNFRGQSVPDLLGWVGQVVRNLVTDFFRRHKRQPAEALGSQLLQQLAKNLPAGDPNQRDRHALSVAEALARLPERRRQVIEMFFLDGLPDAEIGRRLGGSAGAVRVLRFRALQELRALLEGDKR